VDGKEACTKKTGHTPIVFEKTLVGSDPSLDKRCAIPMQVVLQEVENSAVHQYGAGGLQGEEGVLVSSAGGAAGQAAATVPPLPVDDSGPTDALRKAQQAAESVAAAAQDWGSLGCQRRYACQAEWATRPIQ
jgi:hypothetical protein